MPTGTPAPWFPQIILAPPSGVLAVGYKLFSYAAGTSTKQNTYTDSTMATPNSNPIVLNSAGMPASGMYLDPTLAYKLVLALPTDTDPPASPLATQDNIWGGAIMTSPYARRLFFDPGVYGNVGAGETQLGAYTVPANTLVTNGQLIRVTWAGSISANNGNNKTFKTYFGGTLLDTHVISSNTHGWKTVAEIVRLGAASEFSMVMGVYTQVPSNGSAAVSLASDQVISITATSTAAFTNDIVENMMLVELWP